MTEGNYRARMASCILTKSRIMTSSGVVVESPMGRVESVGPNTHVPLPHSPVIHEFWSAAVERENCWRIVNAPFSISSGTNSIFPWCHFSIVVWIRLLAERLAIGYLVAAGQSVHVVGKYRNVFECLEDFLAIDWCWLRKFTSLFWTSVTWISFAYLSCFPTSVQLHRDSFYFQNKSWAFCPVNPGRLRHRRRRTPSLGANRATRWKSMSAPKLSLRQLRYPSTAMASFLPIIWTKWPSSMPDPSMAR